MYTKLYFTLCCLILLSSPLFAKLQLTPKEQLWLQEHPVILVGNEKDWAPFDFYENGEAKGYSIDLVKLLAKKLGIEVQFVSGYTWNELLEKFDRKEIDLMCAITKTKERTKKYSYSLAYLPWRLSFFVHQDRSISKLPKDFNNLRMGVVKGWSSTAYLKKLYPKTIFVEFDTSLEMLQALSNKKIDIAAENIFVVDYLTNTHLITKIKKAAESRYEDYGETHLYFASHKDTPELVSALDKAYSELTMQQKMDLQTKWFAKHNKIVDFSYEEEQYLQNKHTINVCIDPDWMPFEGFDSHGNYIGMTADYFKIFQQDIKIPLKVIKTNSWEESLQMAKARKCDIFSLAMPTPERKQYMSFTSPYLSIPLVLATKTDVAFMDDFKSLQDKKIGIVKGYAFNEIIRRDYPNIDIVDVQNIHEGLQKVANGELFGFIGTLASIGYTIQRDFVGELKIAGKFAQKWELGIGVRNDEPILLEIFEKEVQNLSEEQKQQILNKYISVQYDRKADYTLIIKILAGVFVLALFGLYHYRKLSKINKELQRLKDALQEQVNIDPMTNLYNRRYFYSIATEFVLLAQREHQDMTIMMLDIDFFKRVNDTYGHAAGDVVIKRLASLMQTHTRKSDIVVRLGGEEFAILLPNTTLDGAKNMAQKLKKTVEQEAVMIDSTTIIHFTVSIGLSQIYPHENTIDPALSRADQALYKAKENGRNRVEIDTAKEESHE